MLVNASVTNEKNSKIVEIEALLDSGAGGDFIEFTKEMKLEERKPKTARRARNVDGTRNKTGDIITFVETTMEIYGKKEKTKLFVSGLGIQKMILGFPWLKRHNPQINWQTGQLTWRSEQKTLHPMTIAKNDWSKRCFQKLRNQRSILVWPSPINRDRRA